MKKMTRNILLILMCLSMLLSAFSCEKERDSECEDGVCEIPQFDERGREVYGMVSPVGYHNVEMLSQAPRLDTLAGKTVALVGGSFMASVTHRELEKCILEAYPTAKIYSSREVGTGGPYSVFGQSSQTKAFQEKLKELGVDAVISGNCGCGLCTTKEAGSSIAAEYIGIPTVTVGAPTFIQQIRSTGVNRGVPVLRTAEYPGAFSSHSEKELKDNARNVVFPQIVSALTEEITKEEIDRYANDGKRPFDEIVYTGNYEEIQEFCQINGWTDGLPVTPPTDKKVREYLKFTPYGADKILGTYALAYRECTVYTVAVNAVMAGVPKEFMPICVALTESLADGEWRRPLASTHGWSPYAWLNGPLARQLGIDCGQGMISEETNKALGRFLDLVMLNIGGYYVKENRMGTFGYLSAFTFAEDEEACSRIGWQPYHVTLGYGINDNTVTAASALQWGNNVTPATDDAEKIMTLLAWDITEKQQNGLGNTNPQVYRTVLITEDVAKDLAGRYGTKSALEDALIEKARRPLYMRVYANYWANTGSQQYGKYSFEEYYNKLLRDPEEKAALTDTPEWLEGVVAEDKIETVATMLKGQTPMLIAGDSVRNKFQVLPGGGYVTTKIALPENWNELLAPLGYDPIESFYLEEIGNREPAPSRPQTPLLPSPEISSDQIRAPKELSDGTYRVVPSLQQMTESGRIFLEDTEFFYRSAGSDQVFSMAYPSTSFGQMISSLGFNCSFTLSGGVVTEIRLRPSTVEKKPSSDLSGLTASLLGDVKLVFSVTVKQSKEAGGVTPRGAGVILSSTLESLVLELGGQIQMSENNDGSFALLEGNTLRINPDAPVGATAGIGVKTTEGRRTFVLTKKSADTVVLTYRG